MLKPTKFLLLVLGHKVRVKGKNMAGKGYKMYAEMGSLILYWLVHKRKPDL
jgi:hypothetical protein